MDFIVHNAKVYTTNRDMDVASAFAVKDGKFIAVGDESLLDEYQTSNLVDAQGLPVYPGFIDSHCHFLSLGLTQTQVQLEGTKSYEEVIERVKAYADAAEQTLVTRRDD